MQENQVKLEKQKKKIITIIAVLIVLVVLLFLIIGSFGKIDNKIPTGNVDIFDITLINYCECCDCKCHKTGDNICEECLSKDNCISNTSSAKSNKEDTTIIKNSGVIVYDKDVNYTNSAPLNIFTHASYYVKNDVIAPGTENAYQFIIRNNNQFNIKYDLEIFEENKYNINMQYKLKLNGKYIIDEYVTAEKLSNYNLPLSCGTYDVFTIEWKWIESDNDTEVGTAIDANYKMNVKISATQVD